MKCSTSNASLVASRLFSSSDTRPRQKSEESTSVGLKCFRAKVDLPEPETPMSVRSESSGIVSVMSAGDNLPVLRFQPQRDEQLVQGRSPRRCLRKAAALVGLLQDGS